MIAGWWFWRDESAPVAGAQPATTAITTPPTALAPAPALSSARSPASPTPAPGSVAGTPAPDAAVAPDADPHPHPITPAHLRIYRENNLIGALNGAMDVGDAVGLRGLLDQYRSEFPEDPNLLQQGYQIIADCLQYPGAASKAAGQSYFDRERGSILRRFVARHCQLP